MRFFYPQPTGERGLLGATFYPFPIGERGLFGAVFYPFPIGERGLFGAVFLPSAHRGEGTVRCGSFPLSPQGRGDCSVQFFTLSPQGERTARSFFTLSPGGRGQGEGCKSVTALLYSRWSSRPARRSGGRDRPAAPEFQTSCCSSLRPSGPCSLSRPGSA